MTALADRPAPATPPTPPAAASSRRAPLRASTILQYVIVLAVIAVTIVPVLYVITSGFRTNGQIASAPTALPDPWVLSNYGRVLSSGDFWQQVLNSTLIAVGTTAGVIITGTMAAYPLARYRFRGREALYLVFVLGLLFPIGVAILPLYLQLRDLHLLGTHWGVIIPQVAFALPITVIILRPFLKAIPRELEEAAFVDGTTRVGFFFRILLPLAVPAMVTVGVLQFVASWNAYLMPLLVLTSPDSYTLPLGVARFSSQYSSDTAAILAFTSVAMLPALAFFTLMEKRIVGGLSGAVKG
ncbi:carbohydrate ABC transporter permease [Demequina lignilytica]|uniref:Carbohydrate ABC transporter permease n=1 Tax=Demequina lignilytica TaxID=3051663 RepID=A0AAW7MAJ2_9MICO|nr:MULTISPECIES: carbohydrate ABC transporter permease [unclassified Demequina]MDN4478834.1 carbohydrate ABC transporter permease [Demequina sp. SYSU T00039-1]MDN4484067.1 carbohydrate ABC transporter permease [Demequina sp. SYSU T0a273]MDN4488932.1 carbohydrate ABC transporter permease [Demequina sp. SYSU T00039]MDN4490350.1 carbohydrate ABC transporter permease [Demequina sp. SYSU T00068]